MYQHPGNRPVNLSLAAFRFPLNAYVSILHRITGVLMIAGLVVGLIWLNRLILFPESFQQTLEWSRSLTGQIMLFAWLSALWFHWLAGAKHLLLEHDFLGMMRCPQVATCATKILLGLFVIGEVLFAFVFWGSGS